MSWKRETKYNIRNEHGYSVSMAYVSGIRTFCAWSPKKYQSEGGLSSLAFHVATETLEERKQAEESGETLNRALEECKNACTAHYEENKKL